MISFILYIIAMIFWGWVICPPQKYYNRANFVFIGFAIISIVGYICIMTEFFTIHF